MPRPGFSGNRGKKLVDICLKNTEKGADITDTNILPVPKAEICANDHFKVSHCFDGFNVSTGADLIKFKRKLRPRSKQKLCHHNSNGNSEERSVNDYSADTDSDYVPSLYHVKQDHHTCSNSTVTFDHLEDTEEERKSPAHSSVASDLISPSDLGIISESKSKIYTKFSEPCQELPATNTIYYGDKDCMSIPDQSACREVPTKISLGEGDCLPIFGHFLKKSFLKKKTTASAKADNPTKAAFPSLLAELQPAFNGDTAQFAPLEPLIGDAAHDKGVEVGAKSGDARLSPSLLEEPPVMDSVDVKQGKFLRVQFPPSEHPMTNAADAEDDALRASTPPEKLSGMNLAIDRESEALRSQSPSKEQHVIDAADAEGSKAILSQCLAKEPSMIVETMALCPKSPSAEQLLIYAADAEGGDVLRAPTAPEELPVMDSAIDEDSEVLRGKSPSAEQPVIYAADAEGGDVFRAPTPPEELPIMDSANDEESEVLRTKSPSVEQSVVYATDAERGDVLRAPTPPEELPVMDSAVDAEGEALRPQFRYTEQPVIDVLDVERGYTLRAQCLPGEPPVIDSADTIEGEALSATAQLPPTESATKKRSDYPCKSNPGRKRKRDPTSWKENIIKKLRNSGKEYTSKKGKLVKAREIGPGCIDGDKCYRKCKTNISVSQREGLFNNFWAMNDHNRQVDYLSKYIFRTERHTVKLASVTTSRRQCTYVYNLPINGKLVRVCKKMFLDTFNITDMWITTMYKKLDKSSEGVIDKDMRGKHSNRGNAVDESIKISVREHIKSIPTKESHYVRQRTSKLYFDESLTFPRLYSLYREWMSLEKAEATVATTDQYRYIFNNEFNIEFFKPKKDQCLTCEINNQSEEERKNNIDYTFHIANKCISRTLKDIDKKEAKMPGSKILSACFDLQKILTLPQSDVSAFYYKRKFHVYNFTIFDIGTSEGYCYTWDECIGKKGPNEIASCLFDFIQKAAVKGIKEFRFYSDCCGGQNRNRIIFLMYVYASKTLGVNITHNFFEVGHSQSEGDSMHALIERRKKNQVVYLPAQMYTLIRCAKSTGKAYTVTELAQKDIFDFKSQVNAVLNWDLDDEGNKVMWSKIQHLKIYATIPQVIHFQNNYYCEKISSINLNYTKTRRQNKSKKPIGDQWTSPALAYQQLHPISEAKYKDLLSLCNSGAILEQYADFYKNLPHSSDATDEN